jgi:hypothetical protein
MLRRLSFESLESRQMLSATTSIDAAEVSATVPPGIVGVNLATCRGTARDWPAWDRAAATPPHAPIWHGWHHWR